MELAIVGATGKLGKEIVHLAKEKNFSLVEVTRKHFEKNDFSWIKKDTVCIDVSTPEITEQILEKLEFLNLKAFLIGTTGHSLQQIEKMKNISQTICYSPNFSFGIYALEKILESKTSEGFFVWELLTKLGFEAGMIDIHHNLKKDAPSGTAKSLAEKAHLPFEKISSLRCGHVFGEHDLLFSGNMEDIHLSHSAHSRSLFAEGALKMAYWLSSKTWEKRFYSKNEVFSQGLLL